MRSSHKISSAAATGARGHETSFSISLPAHQRRGSLCYTTWGKMQKTVGRTVALLVQCRVPYPVVVDLPASVSLSLSLGVMWPRVCTNPPLTCRTGNTFFIFASLRFSCVLLCDSPGVVRPRLSPSSTIEFVRLRGGLHQTHALPGGHAFIRDVQECIATVRLVSHFGGQLARRLFYFFLTPSPRFLFSSRFLPTPLVTHPLVLHTTMS